ncbi:hypothetical protein Pint_32102 [Pistacia integerrima]|uniref:Uncharacterized protein n=1 Tax=Pistacia integerrima TaxID=434235 RepID=A0ACC0XPG0_9ROSI|nr:hypothetical protein Pint_32102 [Pistacia integerrima]
MARSCPCSSPALFRWPIFSSSYKLTHLASVGEMAEVMKVLYIAVVDDEERGEECKTVSFRYTRPVLQSTLQLMGCKARHAFKV